MIGDGKLLTNAHCVEHDTQVTPCAAFVPPSKALFTFYMSIFPMIGRSLNMYNFTIVITNLSAFLMC